MSAFFHVLKIMTIFTGILLAVTLVMAFVISRLPQQNPLRIIMGLIARRMGVTVGGLLLIPPESTLPLVGEVGDLITLAIIIYYWTTLKKDLGTIDFSSLLGGKRSEPPMKKVS